jgi:hypothetical protein
MPRGLVPKTDSRRPQSPLPPPPDPEANDRVRTSARALAAARADVIAARSPARRGALTKARAERERATAEWLAGGDFMPALYASFRMLVRERESDSRCAPALLEARHRAARDLAAALAQARLDDQKAAQLGLAPDLAGELCEACQAVTFDGVCCSACGKRLVGTD